MRNKKKNHSKFTYNAVEREKRNSFWLRILILLDKLRSETAHILMIDHLSYDA